MKIDVLTSGPTTLAVRVLPLTRSLEAYGIECKVPLPIPWGHIAGEKLGHIMSVVLTHPLKENLRILGDIPDIVIISGLATPQIYFLQKLLKSRSVKVLFDMADAVFLPTGRVFGINMRSGTFCLEKILKNVDFVTVNGHYLQEYSMSFNRETAIVHDPIDTMLFSPRLNSRKKGVTIGWEGNPKMHYENLAMLIKPLERLSREFDLRFKIVSYLGDLRVNQLFKGLEKTMKIDYGSDRWIPLEDFAECMSDFDILVSPLQKTAWYEGKSGFRAGIGMAMGIPVVASPVGEQKYVIRQGINGFLAVTQEDWYQYLKILIEDGRLRRSMGHNGRETAEKELSLRVCGKKLFEIIQNLV